MFGFVHLINDYSKCFKLLLLSHKHKNNTTGKRAKRSVNLISDYFLFQYFLQLKKEKKYSMNTNDENNSCKSSMYCHFYE